jgi:hypothetical protein
MAADAPQAAARAGTVDAEQAVTGAVATLSHAARQAHMKRDPLRHALVGLALALEAMRRLFGEGRAAVEAAAETARRPLDPAAQEAAIRQMVVEAAGQFAREAEALAAAQLEKCAAVRRQTMVVLLCAGMALAAAIGAAGFGLSAVLARQSAAACEAGEIVQARGQILCITRLGTNAPS